MYLCYVTGELENFVPDEKIPWDRHTQGITVRTDSILGTDRKTNEYVILNLFDEEGDIAGAVYIAFSNPITYQLYSCQQVLNAFSGTLTSEQEKTWIIEYKTAGLVIYCNGREVLNVQLSEVCLMDNWRTTWSKEPTHIQFSSSDDATDSYCFNTGKYNGGFQEA